MIQVLDGKVNAWRKEAEWRAAEAALAEAEVRLAMTQVKALLGEGYDPDAYDREIYRFRAARRRADVARRLAVMQWAA